MCKRKSEMCKIYFEDCEPFCRSWPSVCHGMPGHNGVNSLFDKVEKILKGSLDSIPSPSPSVKIQIMGGKVCLRCKGKQCWALSTNF